MFVTDQGRFVKNFAYVQALKRQEACLVIQTYIPMPVCSCHRKAIVLSPFLHILKRKNHAWLSRHISQCQHVRDIARQACEDCCIYLRTASAAPTGLSVYQSVGRSVESSTDRIGYRTIVLIVYRSIGIAVCCSTTCYDLLRPTPTYYHRLRLTTTYYDILRPTTTYYHNRLPLPITTTYYYNYCYS